MYPDRAQTTNLNKGRQGSAASGADDYRASIRSHVYALWKEQVNMFGFVDGMFASIRRGYNRAWRDGAASCGVRSNELTEEEMMKLDQEIHTEATYLINFALAIYQGRQSMGGKLSTFTARIPMWVNRYWAVYEMAKTFACGDKKLEWVMNPNKEHCSDCAIASGRVYRASIWKKYGWSPKSRDLACGGFKCGCRFRETDAPVTPGRPPFLAGAIA